MRARRKEFSTALAAGRIWKFIKNRIWVKGLGVKEFRDIRAPYMLFGHWEPYPGCKIWLQGLGNWV